MEGNILKVLDTRGALRCVRFESGRTLCPNAGVRPFRGFRDCAYRRVLVYSGTVQAGICGIAELDRHLGRGAVNPPLKSVFGASILLWSHVDMLPEIFIEEGKVGKS